MRVAEECLMDRLWQFVDNFWLVLGQSGMWLGIGFFIAGLLHVFIPQQWIERHLTGKGAGSVLKASMLGVPIPLCSCSVIPTVAALRRRGASRGSSAAFAISSPEVDGPSIALTWGLLGPVMAITRPIGALVSAFTAGVLINRFCEDVPEHSADGAEPSCGCASKNGSSVKSSCCSSGGGGSAVASTINDDIPLDRPIAVMGNVQTSVPASSCCSSQKTAAPASSCCSPEPVAHAGFGSGVLTALRYGFLTLPAMIAVWMCVGFALSAAASTFIEPSALSGFGSGIGAMLLALVIGLPIYVCATSSTPLAQAMVVAGLSPGAALVFLLAGPATNMTTMAWVVQDLGKRALGIYIAVIATVALGFGFLFELVGPSVMDVMGGAMGASTSHATHTPPVWSALIGAALLAIGLGVVLQRTIAARAVAMAAARPVNTANKCEHHNDVGSCPVCAKLA